MAIQEAMDHLHTSEHHNIDIFIFSDSQAALRALDSYTTNPKTISEFQKSLNEMATHLRNNLIWVPGDRNIEGNCIADELARQPPTSFATRTRWVCPRLPESSISGRNCTHFTTCVGIQSQHAITQDSHGQITK